LVDGASCGTICKITLPLSREGDPGDTHGPATIDPSDRF